MIWEKLQESLIFKDMKAETDSDVFEIMGGELTRQGYAKDSYVQALIDREKDYPTALDIDGIGVAIPHTDISHINKSVIAVGTMAKPVKFHEMGGDEDSLIDVSVIFILCISNPGGHIDELQRIINIIQDKSVLENIRDAESSDAILEIIKNKELSLDAEAAV
ncbi:MAG: PTS sugar transporter subunit IIA [Anaerovoracaceae bacterium]|jgi:PTS system galactitol-specific IIA component